MIKEAPPPLTQEVAPTGTRVEQVHSVVWAHPTVVIAANVWRETGVAVSMPERIPLSPDPRLSGANQYVCKIEGMPRYAVCVPFEDFRTQPRAGDIVHVVRTSGVLEEHTLHRVIRISDGRAHIAAIDQAAGDAAIDKAQTLRGLVLGFYSPEPVDI